MKKFRTEIDNISIAGIPYAIYGVMQSYDLKDWSRGRDVAIKLANVKNLNTGEAKHLEQIVVWFVLKAPIELWAQIDTYRVDMSKCSQSTMHTALKNEFVMEMFNYDITIQSLKELESIRKTKDLVKLKNALPSGFMQRRVCRTSLKTLMYIVSQREKHKKEEWRYITSIFEQVYNIAMDRTKVTPEPKDGLTPDGCVIDIKDTGVTELINKTPVNSLFYIETIKPIIGNAMHRKELLKSLNIYFDKVTTIGTPIKFEFDQDDISIYMGDYRVCTISYRNKCTEMYITSNYSRSHMCQNCIDLDMDTIVDHIDMLLLRCILHRSGVAYNLGSGKYNLCFTDNAKSYDNWVVDTNSKEINKQTVVKTQPYKYGACSFLSYKDTCDFLSHLPTDTKIYKNIRALFKTQTDSSNKTIQEQKSKSAIDSAKMQYDIDSKLQHLRNRLLGDDFKIDDWDDITYKGEDIIEVLRDDNFNTGIEIDGQKFIKENFLKLTSGNIDTMIITRMLKIFGFKSLYNKWYSIKVNGAYHLVDVAKRMFYISTTEGVDDVIMKKQFKLNDLMLFDNMYGYRENARTN